MKIALQNIVADSDYDKSVNFDEDFDEKFGF